MTVDALTMTLPPPARVAVVHAAVAGRVRLRAHGLKHRPALRAGLESGLAALRGVQRVRASATTGTVLVEFTPALGLEALIQRLEHLLTAPPADMARTGDGFAWHAADGHGVLARLDSGPDGLTPAQARRRLAQYGANVIARPPQRSRLAILAGQFTNLPVLLLAGSAAVAVVTGALVDAAVILSVVVANGVIGYVTESSAERTIASLIPEDGGLALARRGGQLAELEAAALVPGDLILLNPGQYVPADARVLDSRGLMVDESPLTGESRPVAKQAEPLPAAGLPLAERANMVFKGTMVTGGSALAVVVETGGATELGRIQAMVGEARSPETPMQRQLGTLGRQLVFLSAGICAGMFGLGLVRGQGLLAMLQSAVALAVAALPEGLPTVATTTLSLGVRDMRRHGALIRHLPAVETLGSVQVICFDKTGTLTENRMSVVRMQGAERPLLEAAVLCNDAAADGNGGNGSSTEAALVRAALAAGIDVAALRRTLPRLEVSYRDEQRRYMMTLHDLGEGRRLMAVKGSPEEVLARARFILDPVRGRRPLGDDDRAAVLAGNHAMAGEALRVLGVAEAHGDGAGPPDGDSLTWLGLLGMADPVREGMRALMAVFHRAGIHTVMITGDQAATAIAIARALDLAEGGAVDIVDAAEVDSLEPAELARRARNAHVFARVTPAHKLKIVQALQGAGLVVAMTGDGINDGPALKAADIGIAMGGQGTTLARDVADVVLPGDDLAAMAEAVRRGRTLYTNIRRSVRFLLSTNLSEILLMVTGTAIGLGQALTPMQLLWINLVTDVLPGLALSLEPPHPGVLAAPPRDPAEPIVTRPMLGRISGEAGIITAGALAAWGIGIARHGPGMVASSMAGTSLITAQLLHAYTCRSDRRSLYGGPRLPPNRLLTAAVSGSLLAQTAASRIGPLHRLLGVAPLGPADLMVTTAAGLVPFLLNEAWKTNRGYSERT